MGAVNIFEDFFNMFARFMTGDLQVHLPTPAECSAVFDQKQHDLPCPTFPIHPISPRGTFLFPQKKRVLKGEHFADMEAVKQKTAEALKGIKIDKLKN